MDSSIILEDQRCLIDVLIGELKVKAKEVRNKLIAARDSNSHNDAKKLLKQCVDASFSSFAYSIAVRMQNQLRELKELTLVNNVCEDVDFDLVDDMFENQSDATIDGYFPNLTTDCDEEITFNGSVTHVCGDGSGNANNESAFDVKEEKHKVNDKATGDDEMNEKSIDSIEEDEDEITINVKDIVDMCIDKVFIEISKEATNCEKNENDLNGFTKQLNMNKSEEHLESSTPQAKSECSKQRKRSSAVLEDSPPKAKKHSICSPLRRGKGIRLSFNEGNGCGGQSSSTEILTPRNFLCYLCGEYFAKKSQRQRHVFSHHIGNN